MLFAARAVLAAVLLSASASAQQPEDELVVTARRSAADPLTQSGSTARIDAGAIRLTGAQHVNEIASRAAGTWITRGSGQEHLAAIRSPVLTGAGACGAFLTLEDGIPTRPGGFCNVNQLFEIATEQARALEIWRGPANAFYGANGLHGTIHVLLPGPGERGGRLALAAGPDRYLGGRATFATATLAGGFIGDTYGGFRDASGYRQFKPWLRGRREIAAGTLTYGAAASWLDQETAGFVRGRFAYRDPALNRTNPNPEAFRDADSQRAHLRLAGERGSATLYARRSRMKFLQHFLPGQPLEENGQVSGGLQLFTERAAGRARIAAGLDLEAADGYLRETQDAPVQNGSAFLVETRPAGRHYDYDVRSYGAAPWAQADLALTDRWTLEAGVRAEYLRYDYDNRMASGNLRDDGTACGFGGCLYTRPADRNDAFFNVAPNLGIVFRASEHSSWYASLTRGFRPPQATELYRLQSGQSVADLDPVTIDSLEAGLRHRRGGISLALAAFFMDKRDDIFRDADGFNVSDGDTRHTGIELQAAARRGDWYGELAATFARHRYRFDRDAALGETITRGNSVDTAPRSLGSVTLGRELASGTLEASLVHVGRHYLDAANSATYSGHNLLNIRGMWQVTPRLGLTLRLNNALDAAYADRADFAFGNYRYFPGRGRELLAELAWVCCPAAPNPR